jgi:hypothetical protein
VVFLNKNLAKVNMSTSFLRLDMTRKMNIICIENGPVIMMSKRPR